MVDHVALYVYRLKVYIRDIRYPLFFDYFKWLRPSQQIHEPGKKG